MDLAQKEGGACPRAGKAGLQLESQRFTVFSAHSSHPHRPTIRGEVTFCVFPKEHSQVFYRILVHRGKPGKTHPQPHLAEKPLKCG